MDRSSMTFPFASNEHARLREVREVVGSVRKGDPVLERVAERARDLLGSPAAMVSVVESDHQRFLARVGLDLDATPRDYSICSHTIMSDAPLVLANTLETPEFAAHPAVAQEPHVRFYVGAPIILSSGFRVGSVCALDVQPHDPPSRETLDELVRLADETAAYLEALYAERGAGDTDRRARIKSDAQREFLSLVGHEFRTPLTVLLGNALLLRARLDGATERRMVEAISASGRHLHNLIEHVIRYSNLESGELALSEETIVCDDLLRAAATPVEPIAQASDRQLSTSCAPDVTTVRADGEQLRIALTSLITNAVTHGEGAIEVAAHRCEDETLRMAVYDHGPGLSEDQIEKADRPFTVGSHVDTRRKGGLGLGLPLAKRIVQLHGGWMRSGSEDLRSVVELRLPAWRCAPSFT